MTDPGENKALVTPKEFVYWILFETSASTTDYEPVVRFAPKGVDAPPLVEFDPELVPVLPVIGYCLRLPRSPLDTLDLEPSEMGLLRRIESPHRILPIPWMPAVVDYAPLAAWRPPAIVFAPPGILTEVGDYLRERDIGALLASTTALDERTLVDHWRYLTAAIPTEHKRLAQPPSFASDAPLYGLAYSFLERQLPQTRSGPPRVIDFLELSALVQTVEDLGPKVATASEAERRVAFEAARSRTHLHATWGALGHPPAQRRIPRPTARVSGDTERDVYRHLVLHRSAARSGLAMLSSSIPDEVFHALDKLERHCETRRPKGAFVWRSLRRIGGLLAALLPEDELRALGFAREVTVFSPFPLGLTMLPGEEVPMACTRNVASVPVAPLTRSLQMELWTGRGTKLLRAPIRILVSECLDPADPIAGLSAAGWKVLQETAGRYEGMFEIDVRRVTSEDALRAMLEAEHFDIMILSGHGSYERESNTAGIVIGGRPSLLLSLQNVPPVVLMSACHVAPRARGVVTVADLLLRHGAECVLATLVPVNVTKSTLLMVRFLNYLGDTLTTDRELETVADLWRFTMTSNAINEVMAAMPGVLRADIKGNRNDAVITEFMLRRSVGRLRMHHIYSDTIEVLQEILDERKLGHVLRPIAANRDFLPESLLYVFLGSPERVRLRPPRGVPASLYNDGPDGDAPE